MVLDTLLRNSNSLFDCAPCETCMTTPQSLTDKTPRESKRLHIVLFGLQSQALSPTNITFEHQAPFSLLLAVPLPQFSGWH